VCSGLFIEGRWNPNGCPRLRLTRDSGSSRGPQYTLLDRKVFHFFRLLVINPMGEDCRPFLIAHSRTCKVKEPDALNCRHQSSPIQGNSRESWLLRPGVNLNAALVSRQNSEPVDQRSDISRAKAVVDVYNCDIGSAGIHHSQQRGQPLKRRAIADAGRNCNDRYPH
jgi:hypothetical protein